VYFPRVPGKNKATPVAGTPNDADRLSVLQRHRR
jgi:hypothetical protein